MDQVKQLQDALHHHPRQNQMIALQSGLFSLTHILRYTMVFFLSSAEDFKWTVLVSLCAVTVSGLSYTVYLRKTRKRRVQLLLE